jgi:AcrR family transcriptional regulator
MDASAVELSLPVAGDDPERADARRNRVKILAAAERLFAEHGCDGVSMDAVAAEAGVGKGTLYRRFGDRSGLARAILDQRDREFQEQLIRGEPPLGPGAEPAERLIAFGAGVLELIERHGDVLIAAQAGRAGVRFAGPVYAAYRMHLRALLAELNPSLDADYFADILLAGLNAEMYDFWRSHAGLDRSRILGGFEQLVRTLAAADD